jgi:hypothetical protein
VSSFDLSASCLCGSAPRTAKTRGRAAFCVEQKSEQKNLFFSLSFSSRRLRASACGRARRVKSGGKIALIDFPPEEKKKKMIFCFLLLERKEKEKFSNDFFFLHKTNT